MFQLGFYSRGVMRKWEADVQAGPESRAAPPMGGTVSQGTAPTPPESKTEREGGRGTRENKGEQAAETRTCFFSQVLCSNVFG